MPIGRLWSKRFLRRGEKGRDDRKFPEAPQDFAVHNITWRASPAEFGPWKRVEAVLAAEPARCFRGDAGDFGRDERQRAPRPDGRFDNRARPPGGERRNVWPAPSASGFRELTLSRLHQYNQPHQSNMMRWVGQHQLRALRERPTTRAAVGLAGLPAVATCPEPAIRRESRHRPARVESRH